jgi:hypothetical protein
MAVDLVRRVDDPLRPYRALLPVAGPLVCALAMALVFMSGCSSGGSSQPSQSQGSTVPDETDDGDVLPPEVTMVDKGLSLGSGPDGDLVVQVGMVLENRGEEPVALGLTYGLWEEGDEKP